ncbi:uncharacterized protein H6S33_012671 [Morchella sextelata]|uniref:uncharacterized protein n=1 Tax=Morchella sextelata TaxID=1174677 RepID=UPI001D03D246|nr:uncharacterized protein H6S33_012671 [Morchella sextelata]KAH0610125.1 hypothetical protein H6S33_012671 [Morchella sextelata]
MDSTNTTRSSSPLSETTTNASSPASETPANTSSSTNPPVKRKLSYKVNWPCQFDREGKPRITDKKPIRKDGWTIPRTTKPLSTFLDRWIADFDNHGYYFREDVLMGYEEDEDWDTRAPHNWEHLERALESEAECEKRLLKCKISNPKAYAMYNAEYYMGCKRAAQEVRMFYM